MKYTLTAGQSYDTETLRKELIAAGVTATVQGQGAQHFDVYGADEVGIDAVVQAHIDPLESAKRDKRFEIYDKYEAVVTGGLISQTKPIATDISSSQQYGYMGLYLAMGLGTYPVNGAIIYTMTGERIQATETQLRTLVRDITLHFYNAGRIRGQLLDSVAAATTVSAVNAIDVNGAAWPVNP